MWTFTKTLNVLSGALMLAALASQAATVPRPLLDITIDGSDATRFRPAEGRGKVRLIVLFSPTCGHCIKAVALLNRLYPQYQHKGVEFYGAVVDAVSMQDLKDFVAKAHPNFPVGILTKANFFRMANIVDKERPFVPIMIFVDKSNSIRYQFEGNSGMTDADVGIKGILDKLLAAK